jgi:anti-sigma regulatory factor (Ser/Thr protein kinase)
MKNFEIDKPATMDNIEEISCFIDRSLAKLGLPENARQELMMAVDEAITNVIMYAYGAGTGNIRVVVCGNADQVSVELIDGGKAFDPTKQPEPDLDVPIEERAIGGMGLPLMRGFTDSLRYFRKDESNHFILTKKIGGQNV